MSERVSVVIPAWNAERYLAEAIESVLAQTRPVDEIVVVDDGSTDATGAIAERYAGVRCVRQDNGGPGAARNRGVRESTGELIAFLDADDLWAPDKLAIQYLALEQTGADVVFGVMVNFVSPDRADELSGLSFQTREIAGPVSGALLARRAVFDRVGPFSEHRADADWAEWAARLGDAGLRVHVCPELLLRRRIHGDNLTMRQIDPRAYLRIVKATLDRRRAAAGSPGE